jgi:hypothetical protein
MRQQRRPDAALQGLLRQHHAPMELEMASDDEAPEPQPEEVHQSNTTVSTLPVGLSILFFCMSGNALCRFAVAAIPNVRVCAGDAAKLPAR